MNNLKYKLSSEEHDILFKTLEARMLSFSTEQNAPQIVILGGQPGAGKSGLSELTKDLVFHNKRYTTINGDDYRDSHPDIQKIVQEDDKQLAFYTDPDAREWTKNLLASAVAHKRDIVFESTLHSAHPIAETIHDLHEKGYRVTIAVMFTLGELSKLGIIERYENQKNREGYGRWTDFEKHDAAYTCLPNTLRELETTCPLERVIVCNRDLEILYCNERKDGKFIVPAKDACAIIELARTKSLTKSQHEYIRKAKQKVLTMMEERGATKKEIMSIKIALSDLRVKQLGKGLSR